MKNATTILPMPQTQLTTRLPSGVHVVISITTVEIEDVGGRDDPIFKPRLPDFCEVHEALANIQQGECRRFTDLKQLS